MMGSEKHEVLGMLAAHRQVDGAVFDLITESKQQRNRLILSESRCHDGRGMVESLRDVPIGFVSGTPILRFDDQEDATRVPKCTFDFTRI